MKCKIPEISWHNRDPVLSVDIQPKNTDGLYRLASGGTDSHVLIWYINESTDGADIELDLAADLTRHQRAVNVVKWSPNGEFLASGDDESVVLIWKKKSENEQVNILDATNDQDKEVWISLKVLRGHVEDVYDLCWAPNSQFLVSGSVDNTAMLWDVQKGKSLAILNDHKGFVQGVAWDPKNQFIATLSTDRYLRIFDIQTKRVLHRTGKGVLPVPETNELHGRRCRYFHDDTLQTFFRRLSFTPDGKLLLVPTGITDCEGVTHPLNATYVFSRFGLRQPAIMLPCPDQYTVAVRCCPLLYRLRSHNASSNPPMVPLPYRMIFAVATRSSVYFYDTQQKQPFAIISNIHYTRLTDITWSADGRLVVVSSTDGFCSLITFEQGELGEVYDEMDTVLETALANGLVPSGKKPKKAKENDSQGSAGKTRKASTEDDAGTGTTAKAREPLLEKINAKQSEQTPKATPIQIKRKPGVPATTESPAPQVANTSTAAEVVAAAPKLPLPKDIIIDKEILSSEQRFESPEKKSRPATPISVRRHPRTPNTSNTPTTTASPLNAFRSLSSAADPEQSPCSSLNTEEKVVGKNTPRMGGGKRATPIAVRRTPRALIPPAGPSHVVDTPTVVEEAMDAWPLPIEEKCSDEKATAVATATANEASCTEDIRLVYEDTAETPTNFTDLMDTKQQDDQPTPPRTADSKNVTRPQGSDTKVVQPSPAKKMPRRVSLKTISTPKSKKKL